MASMTTLQQRLDAILKTFPDRKTFGFDDAGDIRNWLAIELGDPNVLDQLVSTPVGWRRARPFNPLYHICAGNLSVSAETSLLIALILGSSGYFKLPSSGLPEFEARVALLPTEFADSIQLLDQHDPKIMRKCEAVVVFGSDRTVSDIWKQATAEQRLLCYGHKCSLGLVDPAGLTSAWAALAVEEVLAYDQLGCLSPQSYLCPDPATASRFIELLVAAFEAKNLGEKVLPFDAQALHFEARQRAQVAGDSVFSPSGACHWVVVERTRPRLEPGPGFGFVEVVTAPDLKEVLEPWRGKISSVSVNAELISARQVAELEAFGIHRVCRMGDLQRPPIAWPHDGRPRLADLVRWTYVDPTLQVN